MAKSYLSTFRELFTLSDTSGENSFEIKRIVIPIIQRDYAQGRSNQDVVRIRNRFLEALHNAVCEDGICLDFIYGDVNDIGVLTPLDGQQRLTTLFLLHWYAAKKEGIAHTDYDFLKDFSYETRYSAREFCRALIGFEADFASKEAISKQIINQSWFPLDWSNDPTIKSMLVMIDEIVTCFSDVNDLWSRLVNGRKIKFYFLPIKNMGLTDELYIKMNSRGKPLTRFEHFKAEFERQIRQVDGQATKTIEKKIDLQWTDFLWLYRGKDNLTDKLFLNYFKYLCDIICYETGDTVQNRSYDEFFLVEEYFSSKCSHARAHLDFLEKSFDVWTDETNRKLFEEHLSNVSTPDKSKLRRSLSINGVLSVDILRDCFLNYTDATGKRNNTYFTFPKIILLYAFLQYALNASSISKEEFSERIRVVNNLISNSDDEINDSDNRTGGNRLPAILQQTKSIIVDGIILENAQITYPNKNNFNQYQLDEEKQKLEWRAQNPDKIPALNMLENHELLYGQISVVGLENSDLFERFADLFCCNRDKITCALLTEGDYSRIERNGWRRQLGAITDSAWRFLFHKSIAGRFDDTKKCLVSLLRKYQTFNNDVLDKIINDYMKSCEDEQHYDWRYYFVKYKAFRPERFGKYWIEGNPYCLYALWTEQNMSENAYQPFLKIIDPNNIDKNALGKRIKSGQSYLYCCSKGFELKDENNKVIETLSIAQVDGVDTEERIEKYKKTPLF